MKSRRINILAALAALFFLASSAQAAIVVGGSDGWSFSTDGMVNLMGVYQTQDDAPVNVRDNTVNAEGFRIKSGFLPGILAFNIKAPTMNGLDMAARVGFYPEPSNKNTKNTFDGQIDLREIFFTVDGNFGQIMAGKGLSLFLGQNLLTEMTLMGIGRLGGALNADVGPTLGRIGYGYVYPQFNAQFRYTTPDMNGFKLAVGVYDPSVINGVAGDTDFDSSLADETAPSASETNMPRFEYELSYAGTFGDGGTFKSYVNGLWQEAKFETTGDDVTAWGFGGGVVVGISGFEFVASAFTGEALGTSTMLDTDSLDGVGEEREGWGYIVQGTYTFDNPYGKTKLGLNYGVNEMDETSFEKSVRENTGYGEIEEQNMLTFGIYHDINPNLKVLMEASRIEHEWFNGEDWEVYQFGIGTFFIW
ncbi:outer membrane channel, putative [Syntrophotalea carbinolica DSM 2380]|uniref:Outer membrane channel, putative n=1 Tax=Syntrophotalea carbinolica (strain DSM 2380 / NBRC 103641 / GraBd1) TaxID=338963 RepID=Q3A063_SYNC1|nr:hypothetical protein [Syntrophotalea carbinolica]ABA90244.1 outer membrane channel, putative [Syntrophotalea carbinolica DSM 2380]